VPALAPVFGKVWDVCSRGGHAGRAVTVKVEYAAFQQITRSRSGAHPVAVQTVLDQVSLDLLRPLFPSQLVVRLLGVTLSNLEAEVRSGPAQPSWRLDWSSRTAEHLVEAFTGLHASHRAMSRTSLISTPV